MVCLVFVCLFYAEENRRGRRAWEDCKRTLKAQGVETAWAKYMPATIPDDENVFGVPEMQTWFEANGGGWGSLAGKWPSSFAALNIDSNTTRMIVARVTIGTPGTPAPDGFAVLQLADPASRAEAAKLITNALGPTARAPQSPIGIGLMLRKPEEIQIAQIFLKCQTAPTEKDLQEFLPDTLLHANPGLPDKVLKFEPDGDGAYRVTMPMLARVEDYLAWSDGLQPQFAVIREALRRPSSQLAGYYGNPSRIPSPNFRAMRNLVQTLGARAQCHFLMDRPEEALNELTLTHDFCRILEDQKLESLLSAMIDVAVRGLYVSQIADGLRLQKWRESDLAALEEQLNTVDVVTPVKQALVMDATTTFRNLENVPSGGLVKRSFLAGLCPSGWGYQHMAARVQLDFERLGSIDTVNQVILADKAKAAGEQSKKLANDWPYTFVHSLEPLPFNVICERTAHVQTQVNQAIIACALERYRLAHNQYPENLDALVPKFVEKIPHDVIGGQPPHYRRAADGTFALYSIGWVGLDNGGVRSQPSSNDGGDWFWPE